MSIRGNPGRSRVCNVERRLEERSPSLPTLRRAPHSLRRNVYLLPLVIREPDLIRSAVSALIGEVGNSARPSLAVPPSTGGRELSTGTIQDILSRRTPTDGFQISAIGIRTETDQISSETMWTKYTMPNPVGHVLRTMERSSALSRLDGIEAAEPEARPRLCTQGWGIKWYPSRPT